jgi:hypothetical protein
VTNSATVHDQTGALEVCEPAEKVRDGRDKERLSATWIDASCYEFFNRDPEVIDQGFGVVIEAGMRVKPGALHANAVRAASSEARSSSTWATVS